MNIARTSLNRVMSASLRPNIALRQIPPNIKSDRFRNNNFEITKVISSQLQKLFPQYVYSPINNSIMDRGINLDEKSVVIFGRNALNIEALSQEDIVYIINRVNGVDLERLDIQNMAIDYQSIELLADFIEKNSTIRLLTLHNNNLCTDSIGLILDAVTKNTGLESVALGQPSLTYNSLSMLNDTLLASTTLKSISLGTTTTLIKPNTTG
jgi:hypothetical protein